MLKPFILLATCLLMATAAISKEDQSVLVKDRKEKRDRKHKNRRAGRPVGINLMGFGKSGLLGASMDAFITPKFAFEAGAGIQNEVGDINYFLGGRYHFLGKTRLNLTPYIGAFTVFHATERGGVQNHNLYFPIGIHRINKRGINWSIEAAYQSSALTDRRFMAGFSIGYRF